MSEQQREGDVMPEKTSNIYAILPKIIGEIGAVGKDHQNPAQHYDYRAIDDVMAALQPLLGKYGVTVYPVIKDMTYEQVEVGKYKSRMFHCVAKIEYHWVAADGSEIVCSSMGEAMDSSDKASNKAMAGAMKYAVTQTLMIPTSEPKDTELHSPELSQQQTQAKPAPAKPPVDLVKMKTEKGTDWLKQFASAHDAIVALAASKAMTQEAEAYINEIFEIGLAG